MADILILGLGNTLRSDDGVGVRAVEMLKERYEIPDGTRVLDGGTRGMALLPDIEGVKKLVVVDAVSSGRQPGALTRQKGEEVLDMTDTICPHHDTPVELLMSARLAGC
jgi:hydrogenase maturation protease